MGFFSNIFRAPSPENEKVPISSYINQLFSRETSSAYVSPDTAIRLTAVYSCIRVLAETLASISVKVHQVDQAGNTTPAIDHPLYDLLDKEPSQNYSVFTWLEAMTTQCALRGNAYSRIKTNKKGEATALEFLPSQYVQPFMSKAGVLYCKYNQETIAQKDILHIPALSFDGCVGRSPLEVAADSLGMTLNAIDYASDLYAQGGFVSGFISHPQSLSEPAGEKISKGISKAARESRIPVLDEGMNFTSSRLSPKDVQFIETMKFQIEEIARIYRVPLHLLQHLDRATNNNIEQQSIDFVVHTIRPWVKRWEGELNRKLLSTDERQSYKIRFNIDSLLRGDMKSRAFYYNVMTNVGAMNRNEVRKLENMNAAEGLDEFTLPMNTAKITEMGFPDANTDAEEVPLKK